MRKISRCIILLVAIIVYFFTNTNAAEIRFLNFTEVELVCDPDFIIRPGEPAYTIQGLCNIQIRDHAGMSTLEVNFRPTNADSSWVMGENVAVQYSVGSGSNWSDWVKLNQLPLLIPLIEKDKDPKSKDIGIAIEQTVVRIRFRVPQSYELLNGIYKGQITCKVY